MKHVHFLPFVGEQYQATDPKMLILGESHYIDCGGNGTPEFTQDVLKWYLHDSADDYQKWMNTFRRFEHALTGKKLNDEERLACWNNLAFYNYLQRAMVTPREAGTAQDYKDAEPAFFEVLETLRPDIVIVWGKRLWQNLPWTQWSEGESLVIDGKTVDNGYYTLPDGHRVYILSAIHPSATMFSCDFWHNTIDTFKQRIAKK